MLKLFIMAINLKGNVHYAHMRHEANFKSGLFSHRKSVYDKVIYHCDKCSSNFVKKSTLIDYIKVVHYGGTRGPKKNVP